MAITPSDVAITAGSGTTINTVDVTNGAATDKRQVVAIGGPNTGDLSIVAPVLSARPGASELGLTVREAAQGQGTMATSQPVVLASDQSTLPVSVPDTVVTFSFTAAQATQQTATTAASSAQIAMAGRSALSFNLTGTWAGTVVMEGSVDGSAGNWIDIDFYDEVNEKWILGNVGVTVNGSWFAEQLGAFNVIRLRCSAFTSGTITGTLLASTASMSGTPEWTAGNGSVIPPTVGMVGGSDGTNLRPISVTTGGVVKVADSPQTSGGLGLPLSITLTNGNTPVKGSAGQMYGYHLVNNNSTISYVQVFNKLTGNVTLGTTAADFVIPLPPNGGAVMYLSAGMAFSIGLVMGATTTRTGGVAPTNGVEALVYFA